MPIVIVSCLFHIFLNVGLATNEIKGCKFKTSDTGIFSLQTKEGEEFFNAEICLTTSGEKFTRQGEAIEFDKRELDTTEWSFKGKLRTKVTNIFINYEEKIKIENESIDINYSLKPEAKVKLSSIYVCFYFPVDYYKNLIFEIGGKKAELPSFYTNHSLVPEDSSKFANFPKSTFTVITTPFGGQIIIESTKEVAWQLLDMRVKEVSLYEVRLYNLLEKKRFEKDEIINIDFTLKLIGKWQITKPLLLLTKERLVKLIGETWPVDISNFCNMNFRDEEADDGKGGWDDKGAERDMGHFPIWMNKFREIPFKIVRPKRNNNKACIVLYQPTFLPSLPRQVTIPVRKTAKTIYFLHALSLVVNHPIGTIVWYYDIMFVDGSKISIPIRKGIEVDHWEWPYDTQRAVVAWKGPNRAGIVGGIYLFAFENPYPEKEIESIKFRTTELSIPILVAITLSSGRPVLVPEREKETIKSFRTLSREPYLIGYWTLTEGAGTKVFDSSGYAHDGEVTGTAVWMTSLKKGNLVKYLTFDGYENAVMVSPLAFNFTVEELTIELWANADTWEGERVFVSKSHPEFAGYHFYAMDGKMTFDCLPLQEIPKEKLPPEWEFMLWKGIYRITCFQPVLPTGKWVHLAVTYSENDKKIIFYYNGEPVKEAPTIGKIIHVSPRVGTDMTHLPLMIGGFSCKIHHGAVGGYFKGELRNVKIYKTALSPSKIKESYLKGQPK